MCSCPISLGGAVSACPKCRIPPPSSSRLIGSPKSSPLRPKPSTALTSFPFTPASSVQHVWLLDPRIQTLEAFALRRTRYELIGTWRGKATLRVPPFEALELELGALWAR
jgi:hypothetical protein